MQKTTINKHGLSRAIPANVKRKVRQRCGFGCVICGLGIIQYEHVDPEYKDAQQHDADKIALLCPQCHAKVTTKFWSKEKIKQALNDPACKKTGFTKEEFDFSIGHPLLQFGGMSISNCPIPIEVGGNPLFKIEPPEAEGGPFRLSGIFCNANNEVTLKIIENEWIASANSWDVDVAGGAIVIREARGKIHLKLSVEPPNKLIVDRLDMNLGGLGFEANSDFLKVKYPGGQVHEFIGCGSDNCPVGMSFPNFKPRLY
jgi:Zn ribbon nucleic-acid-binding protein